MRRRLALMVLTVALTGLTGLPVISASPSSELEPVAAANLELVRVIYLEKMSPIDATKLVRTRAEARSVATMIDRNAIIVRGPADNVDRCEAVLREHDAVLRVADPHAPVEVGKYAPESLVPRVFRVAADDDLQTVVVVLRAIYSIRVLSDYPPDNTVSLEAPLPILDSAEALFRELKLLAPPGQSDGEP